MTEEIRGPIPSVLWVEGAYFINVVGDRGLSHQQEGAYPIHIKEPIHYISHDQEPYPIKRKGPVRDTSPTWPRRENLC